MFNPKNEKIQRLARIYPERIRELEFIFSKKTNVYIDYANVRPWSQKLGWHIDLGRLRQFLNSFSSIHDVKFYHGTLHGNKHSEAIIKEAIQLKYIVRTKPVKIRQFSIDTTSIEPDSLDLLKNFVKKPLLSLLSKDIVIRLNHELGRLNSNGILKIEDLKSNFDVEIGRDMLSDYDKQDADCFILWSGDSDFEDPIRQLLEDKKCVAVFATARRLATELNSLRSEGLIIFDIQKIRDFICYKREILAKIKN